MQFDIFHSFALGHATSGSRDSRETVLSGLNQAQFAEELGFKTFWVAESHFSSEIQKQLPDAVIPNYRGEVGLNADSFQLFGLFSKMTKKMGFGTAILNIVGGNGGPIAAADRTQSLCFLNDLLPEPRQLWLGMAAGRFPYINKPFGIFPRNKEENRYWSTIKNLIFLEALEIFLELQKGQPWGSKQSRLEEIVKEMDTPYSRYWTFDTLELVPRLTPAMRKRRSFVLGSSDSRAQDLALSITDVDLFNLSFTPPSELEKLHLSMSETSLKYRKRPWARNRLPRTVMVFIAKSSADAHELAHQTLDTYIAAMQGTAQVPDKKVLLSRALVGCPSEIRDQIAPGAERGFHADDRLMLWFEFNQNNHEAILAQMKMFSEEVATHFC